MWTFTSDLFLKGGPQPKKCEPLRVFFFKVDLMPRNVDLYMCFLENSGPHSKKCKLQPEKCGPLLVFVWNKVDFNLKKVILYA